MEQAPQITFDQVDLYLNAARLERGLGSRTCQKYRDELMDLVKRAPDANFSSLQNWVGSSRSGKALSASTRNWRLTIARGFMRWLVREAVLATDPSVDLKNHRVPRRRRLPLRNPELRRIVVAALKSGDTWMGLRDVALVKTFFYTGLRLSEVLALDVDQVELATATLRAAKRKGGHITDEYLPAPLTNALNHYLSLRPESSSPALFLANHLGRPSPRGIQKRLAVLGVRAGLEARVHPHALRHAHASALDELGESMSVIQDSMNHASIKTTSRYIHLSSSRLRNARDRLPDIGGDADARRTTDQPSPHPRS